MAQSYVPIFLTEGLNFPMQAVPCVGPLPGIRPYPLVSTVHGNSPQEGWIAVYQQPWVIFASFLGLEACEPDESGQDKES